jgi:hypothetical protein
VGLGGVGCGGLMGGRHIDTHVCLYTPRTALPEAAVACGLERHQTVVLDEVPILFCVCVFWGMCV